MSIEDKISQLEDLLENPKAEDFQRIEFLRKQVEKSGALISFLEHPITKQIVLEMVQWIRECNVALLSGVKDEKAIIQRDCYVNLLKLFSPNKAKLISLEGVVDEKIKEFKEYYKK